MLMIAIGALALVLVRFASRLSRLHTNRGDRWDLASYDHRARCEAAFPFDYLTR